MPVPPVPKDFKLPSKLPNLSPAEEREALKLAKLAKLANDADWMPVFCVNCGQHVEAQAALDSTDAKVRYCPVHGVRLRPGGSCPLED